MKNKVNGIIAKVFDISIESVNENSNPEEVEKWDSLGQLSLISTIEYEFQITLEIEEIFSIMKVGDIYELLKKRGIN